jgi:hypothetical protein
LKQFFKHETLHQKLNALLVIPGLWGGMHIGLLHKVTAMHCDEVSLLGSLKHIGSTSANSVANLANSMLLGVDLQHFLEIGWGKRRAFATD